MLPIVETQFELLSELTDASLKFARICAIIIQMCDFDLVPFVPHFLKRRNAYEMG